MFLFCFAQKEKGVCDMNMQAVCWLAMLVILLAVELLTMGLTTIWFAAGALAAFLAALGGLTLLPQLLLFLAVSILLLLFTRPFVVKYVNQNRAKTNVDSLIGKTAIVTQEISNLEGKGQVQVDGQIWTARCETEDTKLPEGAQVKILSVSGVKLIVRKTEAE